MTRGRANLFRRVNGWALPLGQFLAVFAAISLLFQPLLMNMDGMDGSKSALMCQMAGKIAAPQGDNTTPPGPGPGGDHCSHCLACPGLSQLAVLILACALFVLTRSGRPRPFRPMGHFGFWAAPYLALHGARAPPTL